MSHTKAAGSTKLGRDSKSKRRGVKLYAGQKAKAGNIIVRQLGTSFVAGVGTRRGEDDTIYAVASGVVAFATKREPKHDSRRREVKIVSVIPAA